MDDRKTTEERLLTLYEEALKADFHRTTYEKNFSRLRSEYSGMISELVQACSEDEKMLEETACLIPDHVAEKLSGVKSKRKREMMSLDHRMSMVTYMLPLLREDVSPSAAKLAELMTECWNRRMPENKIVLTSYESIKGGFKKGFFCYITTAVCRSLGKPDDCYELTTLRNYRDTYLLGSGGSTDIVNEYYNIAPTIVKRIDRQENADEIYCAIWKEYLRPCIQMIEQGEYEDCRTRYIEMVNDLRGRFLHRN